MRILVTAGNTQAPVDQVRCLSNIFTGRTGSLIAEYAEDRGHAVTLMTSRTDAEAAGEIIRYRTFDEFAAALESAVRYGQPDAVIHAAAVSDYLVAGIYAPPAGADLRPEDGLPPLTDRSAGKVKSDDPELWLRLTRAPKLVDNFREPWGFRGVLVKFKLEVGVSEAELFEIAERSRVQSEADLIVANELGTARECAFIGPVDGGFSKCSRDDLPAALLDRIEQLQKKGR